mmetsp:Transcript_39596/g.60570  ORF Transcript_39596/g.60570 Transcript_39596/m.60570 type:complete len:177 (+) Transcript_39596:258-788(+)
MEMSKEMNKEGKLQIEVSTSRRGATEMVQVEDYIKTFKWDQVRFQTDKSLKVLGAKISGLTKTADDRLKKLIEEQGAVQHKLASLMKKDSPSFLQKDLGDVVYEQKIGRQLFVNTHGSEIMTSVLVAVNKKKLLVFKEQYLGFLIIHRQNDYENWQKRAKAHMHAQINSAENQELA